MVILLSIKIYASCSFLLILSLISQLPVLMEHKIQFTLTPRLPLPTPSFKKAYHSFPFSYVYVFEKYINLNLLLNQFDSTLFRILVTSAFLSLFSGSYFFFNNTVSFFFYSFDMEMAGLNMSYCSPSLFLFFVFLYLDAVFQPFG